MCKNMIFLCKMHTIVPQCTKLCIKIACQPKKLAQLEKNCTDAVFLHLCERSCWVTSWPGSHWVTHWPPSQMSSRFGLVINYRKKYYQRRITIWTNIHILWWYESNWSKNIPHFLTFLCFLPTQIWPQYSDGRIQLIYTLCFRFPCTVLWLL